MPMNVANPLLRIACQLNTKKHTRTQATMGLMIMDLMDAEQRFIKAICGLIQKLFRDAIRDKAVLI